jgi:cytochrome o ubiquinol oxidase subunit II
MFQTQAPEVMATMVFDPHGPIGIAERTILLNALAIMLSIVAPTVLAILACAWWFRASNARARYRPDWAYSGRIELVVWSIPLMVILFLGGLTWIGAHQLDPAKPIAGDAPPLRIQVVSLDWKWLFLYPEQGIASVNQLVIPVGTPIEFTLTSASVMNAFFVPEFGTMIYTMNGMSTRLHLLADRIGTYYGESAHFSGDGFSDMHFPARVVSGGEFAEWSRQASRSTETLDRTRYAALSRQGAALPSAPVRLLEPDLYEEIVRQRLAPGPGPQSTLPKRSTDAG